MMQQVSNSATRSAPGVGADIGSFVCAPQIPRVVFGAGAIGNIEREIDLLGARRVLILCTPEQRGSAELVARTVGTRSAGIFDGAVMHVPIEVARDARAKAAALEADCAIAIGGGSTIGLGKAIALESSLPILAIPTTYAGSEMTSIYGITEGGVKKTGRDARVLPRTVIYDPQLTVSLPVGLSVTSAINAMAHAAEGLYAQDANPLASIWAEEGLRALASGLPRMVRQPDDVAARSDCLYGAWMCGLVLGNVGVGLHHKLCHTLGGSLNLPHAETHTVVLPHALAYNAAAAPEAMRRIARALGCTDAAQGMFDLAQSLGAPTSLRELGMQESQIGPCVEIAMRNPYWNPARLTTPRLLQLLDAAYHGRRPVPAREEC
nr:maleylacetate reductase [Massilia putida]